MSSKDIERQLLTACKAGDLRTVRELIEDKHVNASTVIDHSDNGMSPLHHACSRGHLEVTAYLVGTCHTDIDFRDEYGATPLYKACEGGHFYVVIYLVTACKADVNSGSNSGKTPLHRACQNNHFDIMKYLVEKCNASVHGSTNLGCTPLHFACLNGNMVIIRYLIEECNTSIHVTTTLGSTPLHLACESGHLDVVIYLIASCNASVYVTDNDKQTPLHRASWYGHLQVVKYLVTKTATDVSSKDIHGNTPLDLARHYRKYEVVTFLEEYMNIDVDSTQLQSKADDKQPLTADELRILKIVLAQHLDQLNKNGLNLDVAISGELMITKKMVVNCLHLIGQTKMSELLENKQGINDLQNYIFMNIYQEALRDEQHQVSMQVFRMILCGIPRTGKTTFWKRLAKVEGFQPNEISPSTSAFESHMISANEKEDVHMNKIVAGENISNSEQKHTNSMSPHYESAMLFDLHLYGDTCTSDLKNEALAIYKHILETNEPKSVKEYSAGAKSIPESHSHEIINGDEKIKTADSIILISDKSLSPVSLPGAVVTKENDPISVEIDKYFEELNTLLKSGKNLLNIPLVKKLCSLADIGGQRAFLEMLPTVTVGKALYLLFFSYENFEKELNETVQMKTNPMEVCTGTRYKQMEVIMQSLICVSASSKVSSHNVALLVGTHVDKVEPQEVDRINAIVYENVKPFLRDCNCLVCAEESKLVLEVSIKSNKRCSTNSKEYQNDNPDDYQRVIMNIVEKRLKCSESERLPASWYMFSIVLRRLQLAGHSVLHYDHCKQIAKKLHIKEMQLQSLLSRMQKIFGIVMYFPEIEQLKDIVICDPAVVYRSISEIIFSSFSVTSHPELSLRLKKWGVFTTKELKEQNKTRKGCQLQVDELIILLQHLGIIAPINIISSKNSDAPPADQDNTIHDIHPEYLIPCILDDAKQADLNVQIQEAQVCSIIPLRIHFSCGFTPTGGFCYLFTKLITNNRDKGWQLLLPNIFEKASKNYLYWRNKVTFKVDEKYIVTLLSTHKYYEIHITFSQPKHTFQLGSEGHRICKKVWGAVSNVLLNAVNEPLRKFKTACECIEHCNDKNYDNHAMEFSHNPDDHKHQVKASCLQNGAMTVPLDGKNQSIIIWFKEPHILLIESLGVQVQLFPDLIFKVKSRDEKLKYEWRFDDETVNKEHYRVSSSGILSIQKFEKSYEGKYKCTVSTSSQPVISVSTEVELHLTAPPERFDYEMKSNKFFLFLNANGISYEVCRKLEDSKIRACDFNLSSYELWSQEVKLSLREKAEVKNFIALCHCAPHTGLIIRHRFPTSAEISWKPLLEEQIAIIIGYKVQVVGPDTKHEIPVLSATTTSVTASKLRPGTSYIFNVSAVTNTGSGPVATISMITLEEELNTSSISTPASIKCPVCLDIQVDPCTVWCGHTICQLCLAKMWGQNKSICPLCKEPWKTPPAINIDLRDIIESAHTGEVAQLRNQYSEEDKRIIEMFVMAKKSETLEPETIVQDLMKQKEIKDHHGHSGYGVSIPFCATLSLLRSYQPALSVLFLSLLFWSVYLPEVPAPTIQGTTYTLSQSKVSQVVDLTNIGIKIYISPDSFSESELSIKVDVSTSGTVIIPENMSLVSAIYHVRASSKLLHPAKVEMEHCVTPTEISMVSCLMFGKADTSGSPPYTFKTVSEGTFAQMKSWGTIQISEFSHWGIFWCNDNPPITYIAGILSRKRKQSRHEVLFLAGRNLGFTQQLIQEEYSMWTQIVQWFQFEFVNESTKILLDISKEGEISGHWKLKSMVTPPQIYKNAIDTHFGTCELRATWMDEREIDDLEYTVDIQGINVDSVTIVIENQVNKEGEANCHYKTMSEDHHHITTFNDLYHELSDIGDWQGLCLVLEVDMATMDRLRNSDQRNEDKKRECLLAYYNSDQASWEGVIAAIIKHPIKNCRVANNIARNNDIKTNLSC